MERDYTYRQCPICKYWGHVYNHVCPPKWKYNVKEWIDDDWQEIYAFNPESVACMVGELYDQEAGEYYIIKNPDTNNITVRVEHPVTGEIINYCVTGETIPTYYAREIK